MTSGSAQGDATLWAFVVAIIFSLLKNVTLLASNEKLGLN